VCLAAASQSASAQVTLGVSNQNVTFTGIGGNALGDGQSVVTWGSCAYNGTNSVCTVSGPFTGLANGGTYNFVLTYPGNGPSPLNAISDSPGDNLTYFSLSKGSFVTSLTEANGTVVTFYDPNFLYNFVTGSSTCAPVGCSVGQVGLTPGATITGPVSGTMTTVPVIKSSGVVTAESFGGFAAIAPATWIEIYGTNLATTLNQSWASSDFVGSLAPTAIGGTTVTIGGQSAFIDYVSPGQVNAQVPSGVPAGPQPVVVTTAGGASSAYSIVVNPTEAGFLAPPSFTLNSRQYVVALFSGTPLIYVLPVAVPGIATARAKPGDNITLYGIGFGPVTPNTPAGQIVSQTSALASFQVYFAGVPATVTYAGLAPGYLGLYQFNVVVPNVAASDSVPFTFSLNGTAGSQNLVIAVQN